jgi:putative DNA primase/helicase
MNPRSSEQIAMAPQSWLALIAQPVTDKPRVAAATDAELLGPLCDIEAALDVIPNPDLDWERWNKFGLAIHAASGGSEEGFALFDRWSQKSGKYDSDATDAKWQAFDGCPADRIGFDYLAAEAHKADPEWRLKAARANSNSNSNGNAESGPQAQQQRSHDTPPELISLRASEVEMTALEWLWPGRFARGKLGLIAGLPDEGKGLLVAYMAACCTNPEREWPCGEGHAPQGNVILFTAEDDLADTVVPRLVAAGANLAHVEIIKLVLDTDKFGKPRRRTFNLRHDLEKLRTKITAIGNVVLIVIDPIAAYLGVGEVDSFRDTDVRAVLTPLQDLAAELHATVLAIMHFNKKMDVLNLLVRVSNSIAFTAAARHVFGVVYDADNHRRLLVRGKNNLAKRDDRALAFRVDAYEVGHDKRSGKPIEAPFLIWESDYVDITATEALQAATESKAPGARGIAKRFLQAMLSNGPVAVTEIKKAAGAESIAIKTLTRAKQELGIVAKRDGPDGEWQWYLPQDNKP